MGKQWAEFLVEQTGGNGKILMVNGVQAPASTPIASRAPQDVFAQNPGITTVEVVGKWDPGNRANGDRRKRSPRTPTSPAFGARVEPTAWFAPSSTPDRPLVPFAGEAENGFRKQMLQYKDQFQAISIGQSPGLVCVSIRAALDLLQGNEVPSVDRGAAPDQRRPPIFSRASTFSPTRRTTSSSRSISRPCGVNLTFDEVDADRR